MDVCAHLNTFGLIVTGIVHIGANDGAEYEDYAKSTGGPVVFIEAIPAIAERLKAKLLPSRPDLALQAVCSDTTGERITFNIASNDGLSSSMLPLGKHTEIYPQIVFTDNFEADTMRFDELSRRHPVIRRANVLIVDTQGADLKVLKGSTGCLDQFDAVAVEVSEEALYAGGCTFEEVFDFMRAAGYKLRAFEYISPLYGDALFMRTRQNSRAVYQANLATRGRASSSSVYGPWTPEGAVNGDAAQDIGFHSIEEDEPWWRVELAVAADPRPPRSLARASEHRSGRLQREGAGGAGEAGRQGLSARQADYPDLGLMDNAGCDHDLQTSD
jgi:FkbM family methyltransferase